MRIEKITTIQYVSDNGFKFTFEPIEDTVVLQQTPEGFTTKYLSRDTNPQSPDEDWDDTLFLVNYHRDCQIEHGNVITKDEVRSYYQNNEISQTKKFHMFKLNAYIHSGVVLGLAPTSFPDERWDVSHVGLVCVAREEWPLETQARKAAQSLVEMRNAYLSGDVYGCVAETYDNNKNQLNQNSCWGHVGFEYAKSELEEFT